MAKDTASMAKNKIRRSLAAIIDPHPSKTEVSKLWDYFGSSCAYCGVNILRESRTGHIDHLVPTSLGGTNNIHNHALACARCNGDEKRETSWLSFLKGKCDSTEVFQTRKSKIDAWLKLAPALKINSTSANESQKIIECAIRDFEHAVEKMRALRSDTN